MGQEAIPCILVKRYRKTQGQLSKKNTTALCLLLWNKKHKAKTTRCNNAHPAKDDQDNKPKMDGVSTRGGTPGGGRDGSFESDAARAD